MEESQVFAKEYREALAAFSQAFNGPAFEQVRAASQRIAEKMAEVIMPTTALTQLATDLQEAFRSPQIEEMHRSLASTMATLQVPIPESLRALSELGRQQAEAQAKTWAQAMGMPQVATPATGESDPNRAVAGTPDQTLDPTLAAIMQAALVLAASTQPGSDAAVWTLDHLWSLLLALAALEQHIEVDYRPLAILLAVLVRIWRRNGPPPPNSDTPTQDDA